MIDWKLSGDEWRGSLDGKLHFTIERLDGSGRLYLRRWSINRDGSSCPEGVEKVHSVQDGKDYAQRIAR